MRYTPSGQSVTSFSVASSRRYTTGAGEQREETEWFNVNAWGRHAELCNQYLTKGQQVYVEGRLHSRSYEGRDGQLRFVNEINLTEVLTEVLTEILTQVLTEVLISGKFLLLFFHHDS